MRGRKSSATAASAWSPPWRNGLFRAFSKIRQRRREANAPPPPPALLFPIKHKDVRLAFTHRLHGHRQGFEIRRKLDLLGAVNLTIDLVGHFQSAFVHPASRRRRAWGDVWALDRIIFPIEFHVFSRVLSRIHEGKAILFVGLDLKLEDRVHLLARTFPRARET